MFNLSTGGTVRLKESEAGLLVILDHPEAPGDMRNLEAGRIAGGGFQPAPFLAGAMRPETLRAIADLIESINDENDGEE